MKISLLQMNMRLGDPDYNYRHAEELIRSAMAAEEQPDVLVLPETWNVGFFPEKDLDQLADDGGSRTKALMSRLASEYQVNIMAGSVACIRSDNGIAPDRRRAADSCHIPESSPTSVSSSTFVSSPIPTSSPITNTAMIFDRQGQQIASYDKVHLFTNMQEEEFFSPGDRICTFELDGIRCGMVICYDIRFVEWVRKTALAGIDILFVSAQWPDRRLSHWRILNQARAIENQIFVAACNSCGRAGDTQYAGHSLIIDPLGEILAEGDAMEGMVQAVIDRSSQPMIRRSIPVMADRRPDLY